VFIDFDPPVNDLIQLPFFQEDGLSAASTAAWVSNLLGPGIGTAANFITADEGYDRAVPFGLAQAYEVASIFPGFDLKKYDEDGVQTTSNFWVEAFDTAFPWARNLVEPWVGIPDATRAQRAGMAPGQDDFGDRARSFLFEQLRGLGLKLQTPRDVPGAIRSQEEGIADVIGGVQRRGEYADRDDLNRIDNDVVRRIIDSEFSDETDADLWAKILNLSIQHQQSTDRASLQEALP
jgi:hypothetical protein